MFIGACLDTGLVNFDDLLAVLGSVADVSGIEIRRDKRASIDGIRFITHFPERGGHDHRHLEDIVDLIQSSRLPEKAKDRAIAMYHILAEAEAKAHGISSEEVRFHEVGSTDSILDVCGAAFLLEQLNPDQVICPSVPIGKGIVEFSHTRMHLPGPAVLHILRDLPSCPGELGIEMTTPTGAAILRHAVTDWGEMPPMTIRAVGYGHGMRDLGKTPNSTRIIIGEPLVIAGESVGEPSVIAGESVGEPSHFQGKGKNLSESPEKMLPYDTDDIIELHFNVDDMNPEWVPLTIEGLLKMGALDAFSHTVVGKKDRLAFLFTVLLRPEELRPISGWILSQTSTAGVRFTSCQRFKLYRRSEAIDVDGHPIRIKTFFDREKHIHRTTIEADSLAEFCLKTNLSPMEAEAKLRLKLGSKFNEI
jgi:hypothetical protein